MLRRGPCTSSKVTLGAAASFCARRHVSAEEQSDIDREAKLRQDIMKKKMEQAQSGSFFQRVQAQAELAQAQMQAMQQQKQQGGSGATGGGAAGAAGGANPWGPGSGPGNMKRVSLGSMLWSSLLYSMALYLVIAVYYMRKPQSSVLSFNGAPQWAVPVETTVAYLAVRVLLSSDKQQELQSGYDTFIKTNPNLSFYQWLSAYQPNALAGVTTTQAEFLNALVAVARGTGTTSSWTTAISRVSRWGDNTARVDAAMANLRRDHAQYVNAPIPAGAGQMPAGQQAYGYGGAAPSYSYGNYQQQHQQQYYQQQQHPNPSSQLQQGDKQPSS